MRCECSFKKSKKIQAPLSAKLHPRIVWPICLPMWTRKPLIVRGFSLSPDCLPPVSTRIGSLFQSSSFRLDSSPPSEGERPASTSRLAAQGNWPTLNGCIKPESCLAPQVGFTPLASFDDGSGQGVAPFKSVEKAEVAGLRSAAAPQPSRLRPEST